VWLSLPLSVRQEWSWLDLSIQRGVLLNRGNGLQAQKYSVSFCAQEKDATCLKTSVFPPSPLCQHLLHVCLCLFFPSAFLHYLPTPAAPGEGVRSTRDHGVVPHAPDPVSLWGKASEMTQSPSLTRDPANPPPNAAPWKGVSSPGSWKN